MGKRYPTQGITAECPHCGNDRALNAEWRGEEVVQFKCRGCGQKFRPLGYKLDHPCPDCGSYMVLRASKHGLFFGCSRYPDCKAAHGAHKSGEPLGIPANKLTKAARIRAHDEFDLLWKNKGPMERGQAYAWMQKALSLTADEAHIGRFDITMCERLIEAAERELASYYDDYPRDDDEFDEAQELVEPDPPPIVEYIDGDS